MAKWEADINGVKVVVEADTPEEAGRRMAAEEHKLGGKAVAPPPAMGVGDYVADVAKSAASGLGKGVVAIPGMLGDAAGLIETGVNALDKKLAGRNDTQQEEHLKALREAAMFGDSANPFESITTEALASHVPGLDYEPKTAVGQGVQTVGEFLPGAVIPGQAAVRTGTTTQRIARGASDAAKFAVAPAMAAEAAGAVTDDNEWAKGGAALATGLLTGRLPTPGAATPVPGIHPGAVQRVNRAIADDGGFTRVQQELGDVGPGAMLADTGPNLRGQGDALTNQPGPGAVPILDAVRDRHRAAGDVLRGEMDQTLGPHQNFVAETDRLNAERKLKANDLYGEARRIAQRVDTAPIITQIDSSLPTSVVAGATNPTALEAKVLAARAQIVNRSDVDGLHSLKESLDGEIGAAVRGGDNSTARRLGEVKDAVVRQLDAATIDPATGNSVYGMARREYAGDMAVANAREEGQGVFQRSTRPDELAKQWHSASAAERDALRAGARDAVAEAMGNAGDDATAAVKLFKSTNSRAKLELLVGRAETERLTRVLEGQARQQGTHARFTGNSATAGRQAAGKEFPTEFGDTSLPFSQAPTPGQLLVGGVQRVGNALARGYQTNTARDISGDVGRVLTMTDPQSRATLLRQLEEAYNQRQRFDPRTVPLLPGVTSQLNGE